MFPETPLASVRSHSVIANWARFVSMGLLIYAVVYATANQIIYRYASENRFYVVNTLPFDDYGSVLLGTSHAAALGYQDMNGYLERLTGSRIVNLAVVGGGITINRLLLDYFLESHRTRNVVYVVDSFAFYAPMWNEARLQDARLFARAPFDVRLAGVMLQNPHTRLAGLEYLSGFWAINNAERFEGDVNADEQTRFRRTYRPVRQIDEQRLRYLYPASNVRQVELRRYMDAFEDVVIDAQRHGTRFIAIKPPIPERVYRMIPDEKAFDATLRTVMERRGVDLYDFAHVNNDDALFFDTDHLNREGVMRFFDEHLAGVLRQESVRQSDSVRARTAQREGS
jgi:hypothetical protein